jgi:hypothetical protein
MLEQKHNKEQNADDLNVSQPIAKPHVIGSQSPELVFARKIYLCVQLLGGRSDILATIGSWRTDVSDEETFGLLDLWIDATIKEKKSSLEYVIEWHNK